MRVFLTSPLPGRAPELLRQAGFRVDQFSQDRAIHREELEAGLAGAQGLLCLVTDRVDRALLERAPDLRVIGNCGVGVDNIDREACRHRGVVVTNTPGVLDGATADLAWALLMAVARRLGEGERLVRGGGWSGWRPGQLLGLDLEGARLGIVGAGRIGQRVAARSRGWSMEIGYADPKSVPGMDALGARRMELEHLLAWADIVSLHVPLREDTRHLVDARRISLMRPGAILINTSRGPVVDEAAVVEALTSRRIRAAGLDVYEREPQLHPGLLALDNVVLAPHLGSATEGTRARMAELAAEGIRDVLLGRQPAHPVV